MIDHYYYQCSFCGKEFSADEIERDLLYLCPHCGAVPENAPLKGVLKIGYDYSLLKRSYHKQDFLKLTPGQFFLYPDFWPLQKGDNDQTFKNIEQSLLNVLTLPSNQVLQFNFAGQPFYILDDTRNPTFSFKDRASILVVLKAIQLQIEEIVAASTGNAGSSLAGICARVGLQAQIWVPDRIPAAKLLQIQTYGAQVHKVKGDYDLAFDRSIAVSRQKGWYNRNTAYNPLTIEGKKWAAFDIFLQLKGNLPEVIFVPVGDGVIIAGLFKGFWELQQLGWIEKLPKLIAVQATGSDALVRFLKDGLFSFKRAQTIADSISAGAPRNLYLAVEAVEKSKGLAIAVTDEEILQAQALLARNYGILAEPAAAASFAGFRKLRSENKPEAKTQVLIMITGNGLKDTRALQQSLTS